MTRPSPNREVVPLLAGSEARREELRDRTRAVTQQVDFDRLPGDLAERRLLPLIGSRLIEAAPDLVPDGFRDEVARALTAARARGLGVEAVTGRVAGALGAAGIRALALKGPLLAADAHGDIGLRETSDIDVLVAPGDLDGAVGVLAGFGYSAPAGARRANGLPDLHFELHHPTLPSIDLHWRVYWYESAFSKRLLDGAQPGPGELLRAQPEDLVASLLLFHARDGFHGVRLAADLAAWWGRHGAGMPPRFLEEHASRYRELVPALTAAAVATERLTGVPSVGWLGSAAGRGRRVERATRLADWSQAGDRDQLSANISLVGGLLAPPGSLPEFARRELTLPGKGVAPNWVHAAKVISRYGIAMWKVRGSRAWTR